MDGAVPGSACCGTSPCPSLKGLIILLLILRLGDSLSVGFEQIILQQGPVGTEASEVIDTYVYNNGIIGGNWGISAAAGLVKGVIGVALGARRQQAGPRLRRARSVPEMTTLESSTIGDDTVVERRERKRPPWMEKPHPVTQVVKAIALAICVRARHHPVLVRRSPRPSRTRTTINASGGGMVLWPTGVTFSAYEAVLSGGVVTRAVHHLDRHHRRRDAAVAWRPPRGSRTGYRGRMLSGRSRS